MNLFIRPLWNGQLRIIPADVMIPYLLVSVFLIGLCLMTIGGKVELERNGDDSKVFVGFRKIGWSRHFQWSGIEEICLLQQGRGRVIVIEGARRIAFGSGLSSVRRDFLLQGLKRLRMGGSIILVK